MKFDKVVLGAGLYGLYAALVCAKKGQSILVLEVEHEAFARASYINQARLHMGYHYPRSLSTAVKSRGYFDRFVSDYGFCINQDLQQLYATSASFSWTSAEQFNKFCRNAEIPCEEVPVSRYFKPGMCDGAFLTREYSFDPQILKEHLLREIRKYPNVTLHYSGSINTICREGDLYAITLQDGIQYQSGFILNATYASINQIHRWVGFEPLKIKYELCEVILCKVNDRLRNTGITVMDGPFFSIMPFGKTGLHSLTAVSFTPHLTSYQRIPTFTCQEHSGGYCSTQRLGNCNTCPAKPKSEWPYMANLTRKYLKDEYQFEYVDSLFSVKPILLASEIDDSRPTIIRRLSENPTFVSVLSGKINTVFDLDEVLENDL